MYKKCIFKSECKEDCASMFLSGSLCNVCPFFKDFIKSCIEKSPMGRLENLRFKKEIKKSNTENILTLVKTVNEVACGQGVHHGVPNVGNRTGSEFRKKYYFLLYTQKRLDKFLQHYEEWLDTLYQAYPVLTFDFYNAVVTKNLTNPQRNFLKDRKVPKHEEFTTTLLFCSAPQAVAREVA